MSSMSVSVYTSTWVYEFYECTWIYTGTWVYMGVIWVYMGVIWVYIFIYIILYRWLEHAGAHIVAEFPTPDGCRVEPRPRVHDQL